MSVIHERAFILSTGDEIVTGQLQDTNARYLSSRLVDLGIMPVGHAAVADNLGDLVEAIRTAARRAPLVIMSGGLGPTDGDFTRAAMCEVLGEPLVLDETVKAELIARLTSRGREVTDRQLRQAYRPRSAACLTNRFGTAPGLHAVISSDGPHGVSDLFALPGPPGELVPMLDGSVMPRLRPSPAKTVRTRLAHVVGIAEADCVARLGDLTRRDRVPLVGITASGGILTLRLRYEGGGDPSEAERLLDETELRSRAALGDHIFAVGSSAGWYHLVEVVLHALTARGRTLSTVESCTGGMLGEMITSVPGSSAAYVGGYVSYANELKVSLGVDSGALANHGAVSAIVAEQMAARGLERTASDFALSLTGIAGPNGGSQAKPVGTVHIGMAVREDAGDSLRVSSRRFVFAGDRHDIRSRAAVSALAMLYFQLLGHPDGTPRLLWEVG